MLGQIFLNFSILEKRQLLHIGQAVFTLKGTVDYFINTVFNYPTLAECYKAAAFNGLNKLVGLENVKYKAVEVA